MTHNFNDQRVARLQRLNSCAVKSFPALKDFTSRYQLLRVYRKRSSDRCFIANGSVGKNVMPRITDV